MAYVPLKFVIFLSLLIGSRSDEIDRNGSEEQLNSELKARCSLPVDTGPCAKSITRIFWNPQTLKCESFSYSGCSGTKNRFISVEECYKTCHPNYESIKFGLINHENEESKQKKEVIIGTEPEVLENLFNNNEQLDRSPNAQDNLLSVLQANSNQSLNEVDDMPNSNAPLTRVRRGTRDDDEEEEDEEEYEDDEEYEEPKKKLHKRKRKGLLKSRQAGDSDEDEGEDDDDDEDDEEGGDDDDEDDEKSPQFEVIRIVDKSDQLFGNNPNGASNNNGGCKNCANDCDKVCSRKLKSKSKKNRLKKRRIQPGIRLRGGHNLLMSRGGPGLKHPLVKPPMGQRMGAMPMNGMSAMPMMMVPMFMPQMARVPVSANYEDGDVDGGGGGGRGGMGPGVYFGKK